MIPNSPKTGRFQNTDVAIDLADHLWVKHTFYTALGFLSKAKRNQFCQAYFFRLILVRFLDLYLS